MNQTTRNYQATKGLMELVIKKNPQANIVFEINSDGVMEHYSGVDKSGKIITYDKKAGDIPAAGIEREVYSGLTDHYKQSEENTSFLIKKQSYTIYRLRNIILIGAMAAAAIILTMTLYMAKNG